MLKHPLESISGIRGIYPDSLDIHYVFLTGCKFGRYLDGREVVVGMDTRQSSVLLKKAAISGLLYSGSSVIDLGITTTPEVFRYTKKHGIKGGIMITASHNPKEWNGIKFIVDARGPTEDKLQKIIETECTYSNAGELKKGDSSEYYSDIVDFIGKDSARDLVLALDAGGGSVVYNAPAMFNELGAKVILINGSPGIFSRVIDPTQDSLQNLSNIVKKTKCNIGFAFDCDGDRLQVVDSEGDKLPPDFTLAAALQNVPPYSRVAISVDTSEAVMQIARERKLHVYISPVGEANVVDTMLKNDCVLGGEGSSAGVIDPSFSFCRDGLLAAAHILKNFNQKKLPAKELFAQHYTIRTKIQFDRNTAFMVIKNLKKKYPDAITVDGVKIVLRNGWCLIRPSRTEDVLRLSAESDSKEQAEMILDNIKHEIASIGVSS
ncbi:MAG: hypothetical protein QXV32_09905 [Conexivisphaerales archaeon]